MIEVTCRHTFPFSWHYAYRSLLLRMMRNDDHFQSTRLLGSLPNGTLRYKIDRFVPKLLAMLSGVQSIQYVEKITVDRRGKKMTLVSEKWKDTPILMDVTTDYTEGVDGKAVAVSMISLNITVPSLLVGQAESLVRQLFTKEMKEQERGIGVVEE